MFWNKAKQNKTLVIDVGTEATKMMLFGVDNGKRKLISALTRYHDEFRSDDPLQILEKIVASSGGLLPEAKIVVGLPPNFLQVSIAHHSFVRKNKKGLIDAKELEAITKEILSEIKNNIISKLSFDQGILPQDFYFTSFEIYDRQIDGYNVPDFKGYDGKLLDFKVLAIFLLRDHFDIIARLMNRAGVKNFTIVHLAEILPSIKLHGIENSLCLDIGGTDTQVFTIKKGKLQNVSLSSVGGKIFTDSLVNRLGMDEQDARSFKENYSNGNLSIDVQKRAHEVFVHSEKEWYKSLDSASQDKILPHNIFVFGGGSLIFRDENSWLEDDAKETSILSKNQIRFILPKDFQIQKINQNKEFGSYSNNAQYTPCLMMSLIDDSNKL